MYETGDGDDGDGDADGDDGGGGDAAPHSRRPLPISWMRAGRTAAVGILRQRLLLLLLSSDDGGGCQQLAEGPSQRQNKEHTDGDDDGDAAPVDHVPIPQSADRNPHCPPSGYLLLETSATACPWLIRAG